jgi:cell wall-associated NlpC family hydrolase
MDVEAATPTPAPAAAPGALKASEILNEAKKHLGVPYVWGGFSPKGFDCSGYVSTLWRIPRHTTDTMNRVVRVINKDELMPGDALNYPLAGKVGHIRIFDKWATADKALVWVYEATEPQVMHRVVPYDPRYIPVRRLNVISDVPMPPPPPLPADWNKPPKRADAPPAPKVYPPATMVGRLLDEKSGAPIKNARVFYWTESEQYSVGSVIADADGRYKIEKVPAGRYELAAYAKGYDVEFRGEADLATGGTATFDLKLAPSVGDLAGTRLGSGPTTPSDRPARDVSAPIADEPPTTLPLDHEIPGGWFFTQTAGRDGVGGFSVKDEGGVKFWSEFQRMGGVQAVGYPVSRRFTHKGFTVQAFQKGVLQWRPEIGRAWFTNVFDEMHEAGKDDWLLAHRSTPRPLNASIDDGKSWAQVVAGRIAFLGPQLPVKQRYGAVSDPMTFFGLPTSKIEDMGNHWAIRLQRAVIQLWKVDVPWAKAGQTTVANGGDVAKEAGLLPVEAVAAQRSPILGR